VVAIDGYEPRVGDRWTIMLSARIDGVFAAVRPVGLPEGLGIVAQQVGLTYELSVVARDRPQAP